MADDPTREMILEDLLQHSPLSAREIGSHLGITSAAVRYHLRALIQEGRVEPCIKSRPGDLAPGRPGKFFRLSTRSRPDNLASLVKALLAYSLADLPAPDREQFFQELADQLIQPEDNGYTKYKSMEKFPGDGKISIQDASTHHGLTARLSAALAFLNRMNYSAAWEAHHQGPQIIFHNCPYAAVWRSFPGLCGMDTRLVENLMSAPVTRLRNIDQDDPEIRTCLFQVRHEK